MELDTLSPLPPDTDIARILDKGVLEELAALLGTYMFVAAFRSDLARLDGLDDEMPHDSGGTVGELRASYTRALARCAPVTALHALRANHLATKQLATSRYLAIRDARADGASWSAIGEALEMSKQGAQDWHNKRSLPLFQDTAPAE